MKKQKKLYFLRLDRKIRWGFVFSLIALALFLAILYQQKTRQENTRSWVKHTNRVINTIDTIGILISETDFATRAYLVTKDTAWITQVERQRVYLTQSLSELSRLTVDNPVQQSNIVELQKRCAEKKNIQNKLLAGAFDQEKQLYQLGFDEDGPRAIHHVKQLLESIRTIENGLLSDRLAENKSNYQTSISTAVFGGVFAFVLILLVLFQLNRDIYRRKKAEEDVALNEEKYKRLIENAGVVMYTTDEKGAIHFSNKQVVELTGYAVEEVAGKHFTMLLDPAWTEQVLQFYVAQYTNKIPTTTLEFQIRTKSGQQKWVEQSSQLLYEDERISGFQCMVKDITEKKQAEKDLHESEIGRKENEFRLNSIINNTTTLIFIKDLAGRYIMVNRRFKEVMNLTDEMVINKTDYEFSTEEQARHYLKLDEEVMTTLKPVQVEEIIETPQGRRTLLLVKFPLLDDKRQVFGISGIATDITERINERHQLEEALKNAEEAKELQEQFLANMSHEIRTPLNGIQGMTTLLSETKLNNEQREFTTTISRSLNNLVAIVNNILDFSNIKTRKLSLQNKAFSIREVIDSIKNQFEHQLKKKNLALEIFVHEQVPSSVNGDAARLKQILVNLVDNAVKFTDAGQVRIEVFLLEKDNEEVKISFSIIDSGMGIPADKLETIFKSFAQANIDISQGYGGAGLGLAISKGLIELQGGNISVLSQQNSGSVFRFILSYGASKEDGTDSAAKKDFTELLKDKRFLVVEDNLVNQRLISVVLQKVGAKIDLAANGKEAIELLKTNTGYDLILMDIQMPVMGGYETTVYIRKTLELQTPIIALTATALKEDQDKCIEVGMNDFILKPFDFKDLYNRITRLLLNRPAFAQNDQPVKSQLQEKLYDLSLLEELDDKRYVYDMILFFLENSTGDINALVPLVEKQDWDALYKTAHKVKGAAGMMQSTKLTQLLGRVESSARDGKDIENIGGVVQETVLLFTELETQLLEELEILKKEVAARD